MLIWLDSATLYAIKVLLADVLLRPRMSLVHQSYAARERRALPQGVSPSTPPASMQQHACVHGKMRN